MTAEKTKKKETPKAKTLKTKETSKAKKTSKVKEVKAKEASKQKTESKPEEITFICKFCEQSKPLTAMVVLTRFSPPVVACKDCEKSSL